MKLSIILNCELQWDNFSKNVFVNLSMCIYYGEKENLTYKGEEHIIPAGLGGIKKLPRGYVSDQFNNEISKLEKRFMRDSIIAAPRIFVGPGKRGSLSETRGTKSKIQLIKDSEGETKYSLCYTKLAKPTEIPTLLIDIDSGMCAISFDKSESPDLHSVMTNYKAKCMEKEWLKVKAVSSNELPTNIVLIGIKEGIEDNCNCFVFKHPSNNFEISNERISKIAEQLNFENKEAKSITYKPLVQSTVDFDIEYFRVYGKIAFNYLALINGESFVNAKHFDSVRKWIAHGGDNYFASMLSKQVLQTLNIPLPKDAHSILVSKNDKMVVANVTLYDHFGVQILLSSSLDVQLPTMNGFICDWMNKKEYSLHEYLKTTFHDENSNS